MNPRHRQQFFRAAAKWLCALLAVLALPVNGFAQPKKPERWLLVFDLSATMKKRLPATETALKNFFANGAEGRLQEGDNIGVWTYDQKMHGGQFPLAIWDPMQATTLTTNLAAFLRSRTYTGNSKLAALQPSLAGVVADSERLTIIIFCDGESDLTGTPYDSGINQSFLDGRAERKKSLQPFVVLIRTLSGKAIGCTVNFPPGAINIPPFLAPSPPTNTPPPPPVIIAVKPQPVVVPDLILVGTPASPATSPAPVIPPPVTNSTPAEVPKIIVVPVENPIPVAVPAPPASNLVTAPPPAKMPTPLAVPATNTVAITNDDSDPATRRLVLIGVGLLAATVVLVVILIARPGRRPRSSLISSSMQDDPRRK
jgi:hypothetical protein